MKIKTSELTGSALDWAVAQCEGRTDRFWMNDSIYGCYSPSRYWGLGGPIIDREKISTWPDDASTEWLAEYRFRRARDDDYFAGPTLLIAGLRCYVASKLGDEIDAPEELLK